MASSFGQGLQNWIEPCFPMPALAGLTHKPCDTDSAPVAMKKTLHVHEKTDQLGRSHDDKAQEHSYGEKEGWSFIQALSNTIQNNKNGNENDKVYVHPLAKRSCSALGEKSLEMCTESLGSETGSDGSQSSDEMPLLSSENHPKERSKFRMPKTCSRDSCFPPPLKTVGSSRGVQVKSHREGGRLILEATPSISCFHAERSEGRLRLWFFDDCCLDSIDKDKQMQEEEAEEEEEEDFDAEHADSSDTVVNFDNAIEGTSEIADDGTAMGKFPRPCRCRCKEGGQGNKRLQNWEPFWVAT